jgi:Sugar (pentulose and hexulose) kinases
MNSTYFLAFDLGATSGRSILGKLDNGKLNFEEINRFSNNIIRVHNKYYWNIFSLYEALKDGLKAVSSKGVKISSIGIDTWGVDFVYLAKDGTILSLPRSYRDPYTNGITEEYFSLISKEKLYALTGIQIMNFNSLFQLYAAKKEKSSALENAKELLFMPDALAYMLTGKKVCEYTIASTSQMLNPATKEIETELFDAMGIDSSIVPQVIMPGKQIGSLTEALAKECGVAQIPVISVAGHDTASAVVAVPAENKNYAYLSSGTWSLMGIEVDSPIVTPESYKMNFTNEGGVDGTIRFLKNITGMWLLEQCRKEWEGKGRKYGYEEIVALSESVEGLRFLVDPDHPSFANPESMTQAITEYCSNTKQNIPESDADFIRCIFDSLALKYKYVLNLLQAVAPFPIEKLHIIGGGAQNKLLNQMTSNSIGIPVVAGPGEATAIGNIMMQAKGLGLVNSLQEIRTIVRNSTNPNVFYPSDTSIWEQAYERYLKIITK